MKTVFKSSELPHLWAHQSAPSGRCSSAMSFNGTEFYSYSTVIGRIMTNRKGRRAFILNYKRYSNTTSGHFWKMQRAIPQGCPVFYFDGETNGETPAGLLRIKLNGAKTCRLTAPKLRLAKARDRMANTELANLESARDIAEFFGLKYTPDIPRMESLRATVANRRKLDDEARAKRQAGAADARAKREAARAQQAREALPQWLTGEMLGFLVRNLPHAYFRLSTTDTIESSHGTLVPLEDFTRAIRFALTRRNKPWEANGDKLQVGNYYVNSITPAGIVAGCHRVTWEEVDRLASLLL